MKKNMGTIDKVLRTVVAIVLIVMYFTHFVEGILGIVFLVIAAIFLITSLISYCPLYTPFGISTRKKE